VLIQRQAEFDFQRTVIVTGEVRHPGNYSLRTKSDRLAEVVGRAGGLTAHAYAEGIRFVRTANSVGRVNVDLRQALRDTASSGNIILQPGDSIEIPEYQPAVKVSGAVNSPGSVLWKQGENLEYYLSGAGGFSYRADKGKVSVRYANGEIRTRRHSIFGASDPKPGPGAEVLVPVKDTTEKTNYVALFGAIAQIVASTVTIIYVIHHP
jgi:protein involved in polysaccharide export with SLBB domain